MKTHRLAITASTLSLLLISGLAACSDSNKTAGQKVDDAVATTERKATEVKDDIKDAAAKGTAEMKDAVAKGTSEIKDAANQAATATKKVISNAAITTAVNAELAKDKDLSALKINVDTDAGRVALNGTAPDAAAKQRATTLAAAVDGVLSVDNRLTVR